MGLRAEHKTRIVNAVAGIQRQIQELLSVVGDPNFVSARYLQHILVSSSLATLRSSLQSFQHAISFVEILILKLDMNLDRLDAEMKARENQKPGMTSYDGTKRPGITTVGGERGNNH